MGFDRLEAERLAEATAVGEEFASKLKRNGVVGIVFLGGVARGYFDKFSDIDIIVFKRRKARMRMRSEDKVKYKGFVIDYEIANYEDKLESEWNMEARWAFSTARVFYDPEGRVEKLIAEKVRLKESEKKMDDNRGCNSIRMVLQHGFRILDPEGRHGKRSPFYKSCLGIPA